MPRTPKPAAEAAPETPTTALAVTPQVAAFRRVEAELLKREDHLLAVLPPNVGLDRFMRVALGAMSRQPRLFDCTVPSVVKSMLDAAELGLEPSGLMGQAYLVPFRNKSGRYEAQLIVGYRGLAELARRSGDVRQVEARVVRQRDDFSVEYGTQPVVHHTPYLPGLQGAPQPGHDTAPADGAGPMLAVYAVLTFTDGGRYVEVMTAAEVASIRARSKAKDSGPWVTDPMEMARKTVLRRALKYAPLTVVDTRVAEHLEAEDRAQFGRLDQQVIGAATEQPKAIQDAAARLRASASGERVVTVDEPPTEDAQAATEAQDAAEGSQDPAPAETAQVDDPVASDDADLPDIPESVGTPDEVACADPSPYDGDADPCTKFLGHDGNHVSAQGATW